MNNPTLWVRSEVMPDGTYGVGLNVGEDRAWALNRDQAVAYAVACTARATEAEHDGAVFAMLKQRGLGWKVAAAMIVKDIHPDRPTDHTATEPLRFRTALGLKAGPFIKMDLDGTQVGEMTTADLLDHATGVLRVLATADLDAALHRLLVARVGLADEVARAAVESLAEHWPASEARTEPGRSP